MSKSKFILTKSLVNVEKEPELIETKKAIKKTLEASCNKGRISLDIDDKLKTKLQIYCITEKVTMTDTIETMIQNFFKDNK